MESESKLCPFKKAVSRIMERKTGKVETTERFMNCAGERCMAYNLRNGGCRRLEESHGTR